MTKTNILTTAESEIFKRRCEIEDKASNEWYNKWGWLSEEYKYLL